MSEAQAKEVHTIAQLLGEPERPDDDFHFFRDLWTPRTCEWILGNSQFRGWMDMDGPGGSSILWVTSGPATGKSVLSSFIIDHLAQQQKACQFFFIRFGDQGKRNTGSILRSLAFQIAQKLPDFSRKFVKLSDKASRLDKAEPRTIWSRVFTDILFQLTGEPLYWVIDGLDEATSPRALVKLLSDISRSKIPIRVLVISRKTQELETAFDQACQNVPVSSMPRSNIDQDINHFIQEEKDYFHGSAAFKEEIATKIIQKANGNFLWVYLAAKRIEKCHTKTAMESALEALPSGMQGLYARMAKAIARHEEVADMAFSKALLTWASFARRPMSLDELTHAFKLDQHMPPAMDLRHSITEVCGGFIRLDNDSNVVMIHQTAHEFLLSSPDLPFSVKPSEVNKDLFTTCIRCLMDLSLRSKLGQGRTLPPFVQYASSSWWYHLDQCVEDTESCLPLLVRFLKSPSVLTWIQLCAQIGQLRFLIEASHVFHRYAARCQKVDEDKMQLHQRLEDTETLEKWATDLVKIVGKFGSQLLAYPHSIHKLIPPFCPKKSAIHRQFGKKEKNITLKGLPKDWDDSLARMHVGHNRQAAIVVTAGLYVAILAKSRQSGEIFVYETKTYKQCQRFNHEERVLLIAINSSGNFLATFGYRSTKIWNLATGSLLHTIPKPSNSIPMTALFDQEGIKLTAAYSDRTVRQLSLDSDELSWQMTAELEETEEIEGTFYNSPTSIALNPNGREVLIGYRAFPLTLWDIEAVQPMYRCMHTSATGGSDELAWPAVRKVIWRPQSNEVFGIYDNAAIFKWDPVIDSHQLGASEPAFDIACSPKGHYFATGHVEGSIQIWNATTFKSIYKISSTLLLSGVTFSSDSRRIYDIRGSYCNVWEPDVLIRLTEIDEEGASSYAAAKGTSETITPVQVNGDSKADILAAVTCLASCPVSSIYCAGNDDGYVHLVAPDSDMIIEVWQGSVVATSIEAAAWTNDGKLMCAADLSGRLRVYAVVIGCGSRLGPEYNVDCVLDIFVNIESGSIRELLFSPQGDQILVITLARLTVISTADSKVIATLAVESSRNTSKWTPAPFHEDLLLEIYTEKVNIYSWLNLAKLASVSFSDTPKHSLALVNIEDDDQAPESPELRLTRNTSDGAAMHLGSSFQVERTRFTPDKTRILVQISHNSREFVRDNAFFMIDTASLAHGTSLPLPELGTSPSINLPCHFLSSRITRRIQVPLGFVSNDRLVFLDHDFWLCSTSISSPNIPSSHSLNEPSAFRRKGSATQSTFPTREIIIDGITQHYCLPADWRSLEGLKMMSLLGDGTLLCPRNEEVAAVGCGELRSLSRA